MNVLVNNAAWWAGKANSGGARVVPGLEYTAVMTTCFLMAAAMPGDASASIWAQWGLAGVVVAYTLWRDADREKRLGSALDAQALRLDEVQRKHAEFIQGVLMDALERNTAAIQQLLSSELVHSRQGGRRTDGF